MLPTTAIRRRRLVTRAAAAAVVAALVVVMPGTALAELSPDDPTVGSGSANHDFREIGYTVVALQPDPGSAHDLDIYDWDGDWLATSAAGSNLTDFVALPGIIEWVDGEPKIERLAAVRHLAGDGGYRVQLGRPWDLSISTAAEPGWNQISFRSGGIVGAAFLHTFAHEQVTITASGHPWSSGEVFAVRGTDITQRTRTTAVVGVGFPSGDGPEGVTTFDAGPCTRGPGHDGTCVDLVLVFISTTEGDGDDAMYVKVGPYDGSVPPF